MLNSSLAFAQVLVSIALALLSIIQATGRKEKPHQVYAVAFVALAASFVLFISQEKLPAWLGIVVANGLILNAHLLFAYAFRLSDRNLVGWPRRFWAYEIVSFVALVFFTYLVPEYFLRAVILSVSIAIMLAECILALLRGYQNIPGRVKYPVVVLFILFIACHFARIAMFFFFHESQLMGENPITTFTFSFTIFFSVVCSGMFLLMDSYCLIERLDSNNKILETLALKDELTGVLNRHSLEQTVTAEMERQDRYHAPLSLIMLDLDHFKRVNDIYGHDSGDMVLAKTTKCVGENIRETDLLFRWGGEEFFILLPNTHLAGASALAEKLRTALEGTAFPPVGTITASFGVAERIPLESRASWFKRVDQAMYRAKLSGRNRVEVWTADNPFREAMVSIEWHDAWNCGVEIIDSEHQNLIRKGNELLNMALSGMPASSIKPLLDALITDIRTHFSDEEKILEKMDYPAYREHREIHKELVAEALIVQDNFDNGIVDASILFHLLVDKIIVEHMLSTDSKFFPFLAG